MKGNIATEKEEDVIQPYLNAWCSHLGTEHDPAVCYSFPNKKNCCYKLENPQPLHLDHQATHCLKEAYKGCVIFQDAGKAQKIPKDLLVTVIPKKKRGQLKMLLLFILVVAVAGVIFSLAFFNFYELNNLYTPSTPSYNILSGFSETSNTQETSTSSNELDLLFIFPRKTKTEPVSTTLPIEDTPTPTAGPRLRTPIGSDGIFLIHQAQLGDNLPYLATLYGTNVETIQSVNCLQEGNPIMINQILVIMRGEGIPGDQGCLEAINIEKDTALQAISNQYNITQGELIRLNQLGDIKIIPAGRWLIVPAQ